MMVRTRPRSQAPHLIDLSHTIQHGLLTYKGLPAPVVSDYLSREASRTQYEEGVSFQIGSIEMVANTGTYIDSPFHRYADGEDVSELELRILANLDGIVFHAATGVREIGRDLFRGAELKEKAVLIHSGWDLHWETEQYSEDHPFLTRDAAEHLRDAGAALVGIDSYNIDNTSDGARPVHSVLLGAGIPIVEHLCNVAVLPEQGFKFYAVPVKVRGMGTFPVRAFAVVGG